jgi:hypothetical protein
MKEFRIFWSPIAEKTYLSTLIWILNKWTIKEVVNFENKVNGLIDKLKFHQNLCPASNKNLRRCVITPQTSMVYQINGNLIELVAFFDNRSAHQH